MNKVEFGMIYMKFSQNYASNRLYVQAFDLSEIFYFMIATLQKN